MDAKSKWAALLPVGSLREAAGRYAGFRKLIEAIG